VISIAGGMGAGALEPCGKDTGLIQFDAISEVNLDWSGSANIVVFARYWVCADYYAVSVLWTEPHGGGRDLRSLRVLSDETGFRMNDEHHSFYIPANTIYAKPVGERPAFRWFGGSYGAEEMRFAEADALARRVYVSDLVSVKDRDGTFDVDVPQDTRSAARNLAHVKVEAKDNRIDSMELFDREQRLLAGMEYAYERDGGPRRLATLTAELPVRPVKLGSPPLTIVAPDGQITTGPTVPDVNYVSHKGGRTCTVTYEDVALGKQVLRLPVRIRVVRSDNKQLLRSARLMNFKRVDLDKDEVWQAAGAFGGLGSMYATWEGLMKKLVWHTPDLGPLSVDPNDPAVVRRLTAKYPVWDPPSPGRGKSRIGIGKREGTSPDDTEVTREEAMAWKRERTQSMMEEQERLKEFRRRVARMPRPPRKDIEPDDARLIRQLCAHYEKSQWTKEQRAVPKPDEAMVRVRYIHSPRGRQIKELLDQLYGILRYHREPTLPEDRPPEPNESDLKLMGELKSHYEKLALERDRGPGGRLKAINLLTGLDRAAKDFDSFESHVVRYLQMLD